MYPFRQIIYILASTTISFLMVTSSIYLPISQPIFVGQDFSSFVYMPFIVNRYPLPTHLPTVPPVTPIMTPTPTETSTQTSEPTATNTPTPTNTPTATSTATPTNTATPTETTIPVPVPEPGLWTGTTSRGHPMSFEVTLDSSQWYSFTLKTDFTTTTCPSQVSGTFTVTADSPNNNITNGEFSYDYGGYSFNGEFTSETTATGTYTFNHYLKVVPQPFPWIVCHYYFDQTGTWDANAP